jgi:hypothetical protein
MTRLLKLSLGVTLLILIAVGCSSGAEIPVITITWDGQSCHYQGPETVKTEEIKVIYQDEDPGGRTNVLRFKRLEEGKTWEDFLGILPNDGEGGPVSEKPPAWLQPVMGSPGENENEQIFTVKPGNYAIWCYPWTPDEFYPGGFLIVE